MAGLHLSPRRGLPQRQAGRAEADGYSQEHYLQAQPGEGRQGQRRAREGFLEDDV